jgi:hypothetical protein
VETVPARDTETLMAGVGIWMYFRNIHRLVRIEISEEGLERLGNEYAS